MDDSQKESILRVNRFIMELTQSHSPTNIEIRAENAFGVAVKFINLLVNAVDDDDEQRKLLSAWFKAIRDNDYKKFKRAFRRYNKKLSGIPDDGDPNE